MSSYVPSFFKYNEETLFLTNCKYLYGSSDNKTA